MEVSSNTPAVVTGGASGLGEATARALAAKGAKVAIFDMNEEKGEAVAKDIGGIFCKVNVTSDEDVDAGFAKAREAIRRIAEEQLDSVDKCPGDAEPIALLPRQTQARGGRTRATAASPSRQRA